MKPAKFTFRRQPREIGLAAVAHPYPQVDIKLRGEIVGAIIPPNAYSKDSNWRVRFMVVSEKEKCGWVWVAVKARFASEEEARAFVLENNARLQENLKLRPVKDAG